MKKIKILFCVLFVGLSVSSYLIATHKRSATELLLLNVEALSLDELDTSGCLSIEGYCIADNGDFIRGMGYRE